MNFKTIPIFFIIWLMLFNMGQLNAQTNDYNNSLNRYSFDLYRETKVEKENLFLSPLSTYYALLLAYEGSKNKTKQEFEKVLYLKKSAAMKDDYLHRFANKSDSSGFNVFNAIWLDKGFEVEANYRKSVSDKYLSDFERTEFANTETALTAINGWVSEKTNRRINEIVSAENIDAATKLVLTNVVYFKGEWLTKFDKQKTVSAPFFTSLENQYKVDFMKKNGKSSLF